MRPESAERALELAVEAQFVAIEKFLGVGLVSEGSEGERGVVEGAGGLVWRLRLDLGLEIGAFLAAGFVG